MIFSYFNVEPAHQPRVLKWGILGAIVLRFVLILLGTYLVSRFEWVFVLFGIGFCIPPTRWLSLWKKNLTQTKTFCFADCAGSFR
jgi:predicted tellurium resistance membrane protein TerC